MTPNQRQLIDFKVRVHSVPEDLREPLPPEHRHLSEASFVYRMAVESRLLWDVWMIDQYRELWIAISFENEEGEPEFHTLKIAPETCRKIPCDPYEAIVEQPIDSL